MPPAPGGPRLPRELLHVFPGFGTGGAQMRFVDVANHWGRRYRHRIVALNGDQSGAARLDAALDVTFAPAGVVAGDTVGNVRRIRAALVAWAPDVLVTSNWGAMDWALAQSMPFAGRVRRHVHTEDGFGPEERDRQLRRRVWTRRWALRRAEVVVPSRTLLGIARTIWRLDPARLHPIANGVDLARFADRGVTGVAPWGVSADPVIGTVAALRAEKNIGRLLQAARLVHDRGLRARIVVVGEGPERAALEGEAAALGLQEHVVFTGHLAEPATAYRHFDLFALSSDTEQMPLSVLEAMAARRAVVATDVGDVSDMLAPDNLPFVTPRDPGPLAAALLTLLQDPARRAAIGAANQAKAARDYGQQRMFDAYAALFDGA